MEGVHHRMQLNPALMPARGYVAIPLAGGIGASAGSSSIGFRDIMDAINEKSKDFYLQEHFQSRLKETNKFHANANADILAAGWYSGKGFWSFNVGLRADAGLEFSKSYFTHLSDALSDRFEWGKTDYNLSGQSVNLRSYMETGIGYARQVNERLSLGGRLKVLFGTGTFDFRLTKAVMKANLPSEQRLKELSALSGQDVNTREKVEALVREFSGYSAHFALEAELKGAAAGVELADDKGYIGEVKFDHKDMGVSGYGVGLDLGMTYKMTNRFTLSASVVNLGFIRWKESAMEIIRSRPEPFVINGEDYARHITYDPANPQATLDELYRQIGLLTGYAMQYKKRLIQSDIFQSDMLQLQKTTDRQAYRTALASTVVLGAEYELFPHLSVGLLSTTRFTKIEPVTELTLSANYSPKSRINLSLSYSALRSHGKGVGIGLKLGPLFLGTDYLLLNKNMRTLNAVVGLSIPLKGKKTEF